MKLDIHDLIDNADYFLSVAHFLATDSGDTERAEHIYRARENLAQAIQRGGKSEPSNANTNQQQ